MNQPDLKTAVSVRQREVPALNGALHENPLVHRILAARGVSDSAELGFSLADLPRPDSLPDIDAAVRRLLEARERGERVLIVGDYDCDGATSTAVAMLGLQLLGFEHVDYLIPSRFAFGYGLSPAIVDVAKVEHAPHLIVTVDNGIASVEGVAHASSLGIDVIVTDHHLAPVSLPVACALVNPNIPGAQFPAKNLAGVGVVFYTLLAVRSALQERRDAFARAALAQLLDLVAIGTVADVVPLDKVNRILVEQGLRRIRAGQTRPGVMALLQEAGRASESISTQDIGFGLGPRLNAAGRLDDMRLGVQCLLADSDALARHLAAALSSLNQKRRVIEQDMRTMAEEQLDALQANRRAAQDGFGVCLMDDSWHQGVIGILASRIKEQIHRPVVVFTADDEHNLKGSARSIPGVHIRDVLQEIVAKNPGMIEKFGGHAMAAGLTLPRKHYEAFNTAFEQTIERVANGQHAQREFVTDGSLNPSERSLGNAQLLANLMPWGQSCEAPVFADNFRVKNHRVVGNGHLKLTLVDTVSATKSTSGNVADLDAIAFNCSASVDTGDTVFMVYSLDVNTWRDRQSLQLRVHHLERAGLR
ncbi:MAG: single-stranded-DNA-specific exonuclease RecJ [Granulosicoccus sp.]